MRDHTHAQLQARQHLPEDRCLYPCNLPEVKPDIFHLQDIQREFRPEAEDFLQLFPLCLKCLFRLPHLSLCTLYFKAEGRLLCLKRWQCILPDPQLLFQLLKRCFVILKFQRHNLFPNPTSKTCTERSRSIENPKFLALLPVPLNISIINFFEFTFLKFL